MCPTNELYFWGVVTTFVYITSLTSLFAIKYATFMKKIRKIQPNFNRATEECDPTQNV